MDIFSRDLQSLMFLLLQLISRGKKDGAALFPDKKAGREREESGGEADLKCQYCHDIFRMGILSLPSSRAVVFIGPHCGIRTLSI